MAKQARIPWRNMKVRPYGAVDVEAWYVAVVHVRGMARRGARVQLRRDSC
ncbi:hypothetical protein ES332_D03G087000v1 [Gossypium tomentosum]|uniref:Uncharacterized protein n=1 Tax=Gossypium tomentosum TaxID=34277 RepID=A0A5D2LNZ6_GOSTO|nr:hypothetical protein ES332_D03G087000v1 [Gossypium tomentosum]